MLDSIIGDNCVVIVIYTFSMGRVVMGGVQARVYVTMFNIVIFFPRCPNESVKLSSSLWHWQLRLVHVFGGASPGVVLGGMPNMPGAGLVQLVMSC